MFNIFHWLPMKEDDQIESEKHFSQLYDGLKPKFILRSYSFIMLLRRLIYICIVLFSQIYIILTVLFLFLIQIAYLTTIIVLRPYKTIKNNAIDMINEIVYIVCIGLLFYYNKASHWNKTVESVFIYLFLGSTF